MSFAPDEFAVLFEHAHHGEADGHQRGLRVLGQREIGFGALPHETRERLLDRLVDFFEEFARGRKGFAPMPGPCRRLGCLVRET